MGRATAQPRWDVFRVHRTKARRSRKQSCDRKSGSVWCPRASRSLSIRSKTIKRIRSSLDGSHPIGMRFSLIRARGVLVRSTRPPPPDTAVAINQKVMRHTDRRCAHGQAHTPMVGVYKCLEGVQEPRTGPSSGKLGWKRAMLVYLPDAFMVSSGRCSFAIEDRDDKLPDYFQCINSCRPCATEVSRRGHRYLAVRPGLRRGGHHG